MASRAVLYIILYINWTFMVPLFYKILLDLSWVGWMLWKGGRGQLKMHGTFLEKIVRKCEGNNTLSRSRAICLAKEKWRVGISLGKVCGGAQRGYILGGVLAWENAKLIDLLNAYFGDTIYTFWYFCSVGYFYHELTLVQRFSILGDLRIL